VLVLFRFFFICHDVLQSKKISRIRFYTISSRTKFHRRVHCGTYFGNLLSLLKKVIAQYAEANDEDAAAIVQQLEPRQKNSTTLAKWQHELKYMHRTAEAAVTAKKQQHSQKLLEKVFAEDAKRVVKLGVTVQPTMGTLKNIALPNKKSAKQAAEAQAIEQIHNSVEKALTLASEIEDESICLQFGKEAAHIDQIEDANIAKASLKMFEAQVERTLRQQRKQHHLIEQKDAIALSLSHVSSPASTEIIADLAIAKDEVAVSLLAKKATELIEENHRAEMLRMSPDRSQRFLVSWATTRAMGK
jgi:hypothetical protein